MADSGTIFGGLGGAFSGAGRALERVMAMREAIEERKAEKVYREKVLEQQTLQNQTQTNLEEQKLALSRQLAEDQRIDRMVEGVVSGLADMQVVVDPAGIRDRIRARLRAEATQEAAPPVENLQRDIGGALQRGADVARTTVEQQDYSSRLRGAATAARQTIGDQPGQTAPVMLDGQTVGTAYSKPSSSQRIVSNRAESERVKLLTELLRGMSAQEQTRVTQYYSTLRSITDNLTADRWGMMSPEEKAMQVSVAKQALDRATGGMGVPDDVYRQFRMLLLGELGFDFLGEVGGGTARRASPSPQVEGAETTGSRRTTRGLLRDRINRNRNR